MPLLHPLVAVAVRCGSDKHLAKFPPCPAAKATCKSCHKTGHFAHVCCSSKTSDEGEIQLPKLTMLYLSDPCHAPETLLCKINISTPAFLANEQALQCLFCHTTSMISTLVTHHCSHLFVS